MGPKLPSEVSQVDNYSASMTAMYDLMLDLPLFDDKKNHRNMKIMWIDIQQEIKYSFELKSHLKANIRDRVRLTFPAKLNKRSIWASLGTIFKIRSGDDDMKIIYVLLDDPPTYKWLGTAPTREDQGFVIDLM